MIGTQRSAFSHQRQKLSAVSSQRQRPCRIRAESGWL